MAVVSMICCWTSLSDVKCSVRDDEGGGVCVDTQENFEIKLAESFGFVISSIREIVSFRREGPGRGSLQTEPSVWRIDAAHAAPAARLCSALALTTGRSSYPVPS